MKEYKCKKCGEVKPLNSDYFNTRKDSPTGFRYDCKVCRSERNRKYFKDNQELCQSRMREYRRTSDHYKQWSREYDKKYFEDPVNKLKRSMRFHTTKGIINNKLHGTEEILGCTWEFFRDYIEQQFTEGMTWDNYGDWHLDHIIPLSSAKTDKEVYRLNHYTNLQPLWAEENLKKSDKIFDLS